LEIAHDLQALVPTPFEFGGDNSIVGIHRIILTRGARSLKAGLLQSEFKMAAFFRTLHAPRLDGAEGRFDPMRLQPRHDFSAHSLINPEGAKRDARVGSVIEMGASAMIARDIAVGPAIGDVQFPPAMAAA
jgi:hypothetical protein